MVDLEKINRLGDDILAFTAGAPGANPAKLSPELEERRYELLADHLGYAVANPINPIYVVGDSHSIFFSGAESLKFSKGRRIWSNFLRARYVCAFTELLPTFRVFHLGPTTAWQSFSPKSSTWAKEKLFKLLKCGDIPKGAQILLVFGEIDIRCHIPKAVLSGKSIEEAVNATVARFMRLPKYLLSKGYRPAIWLPSLTAKHTPDKEDLVDNPLPYIGSHELRTEICDAYCDQLKTGCVRINVPVSGIDSTIPISDDQCFLDGHHLSQNVMPTALSILITDGILKIERTPRSL